MATITDKDGNPVSEQEQIDVLIAMGISPEEARFLVALEAGHVGGDVVAIDEVGNETTPPVEAA